MKTSRLDDMTRGWFIGNFSPSMYRTNDCEVAVKQYPAGAHEAKHYHKIATEFTVLISGRAKMFGREFAAGDIIECEPGDATDFTALTDVVTVVVKVPGANDDKYVCMEEKTC